MRLFLGNSRKLPRRFGASAPTESGTLPDTQVAVFRLSASGGDGVSGAEPPAGSGSFLKHELHAVAFEMREAVRAALEQGPELERFAVEVQRPGQFGNASACDAPNAHLDRGKKDDVVDAVESGRCREGVEKSGADDAVVHGVVPVANEVARSSCGRLRHDRVLLMRFRSPWLDRASAQEPEERVALDQHAEMSAVGEHTGECGEPHASPSDAAVVASTTSWLAGA